MIEDKASRTALRVAMRRAAHQILDDPKVLDDPIALPILPVEAERRLREGTDEWQTPSERALRAFMVARSRYAEDRLAAAVHNGARQFVVLGAGLDTYAYRNPSPSLRVFEVDHPATQEWKRKQLERSGIAIPEGVQFVPIDFERQTLQEGLAGAGFLLRPVSFFSWLGVTQYLTRDAVLATLRFIACTGPGSGVVFDYSVPRASLGPIEQIALDDLMERVARAGEPFRHFFDPPELDALLREIGFREIEDLGPAEINQRYFQNRRDGLRIVLGLGRLASAAT
ncbi:MAG TPA: class I SAM-dependent methyltransferase [Bryobacteraceae bacterium]|nr:class I SAM-dependent methyltransferase [Bryobacteraceae bacterium]